MSLSLIQNDTLTALADAVRELTGTDFLYTPGEMTEALRELRTPDRAWTRPDGWPDYDSCIKRAGQDVLYLTCTPTEDNSTVVFQITTAGGGQYLVERGSIDSDGFTAAEAALVDSGTAYEDDLGTEDEYAVFRLTAPDDALSSFCFGTTSAATSYPVGEIWGRTEDLTVPAYGFAGSELQAVDILTGTVTLGARAFRECGAAYLNVRRWDAAPTSLQHMFYNCGNLSAPDLGGWDTSNAKDMSQAFYHCTALTGLDLSGWDTGSVTTLYYTFSGCTALTDLDLSGWNTENVTTMAGLFSGCSGLVSLNLGGWDTGKVTTFSNAFTCSALTDFTPPEMHISFSLSGCPQLSDDSIQAVIDCLQEVEEAQTLTLHSTVLAKLTEEQLAAAEAKGWTVA